MNRSVLVIAHNEASAISTCISSLQKQSVKPYEIVVICHNCTDQTASLARTFKGVTVVEYNGPEGVPYARMKGFTVVSGDVVACIDGDSVANYHWLKNITKPLLKNNKISIVAGYVILTNNLFSRISSFVQFFIMRKILKQKMNYFAWGSNFACRKIDYEKVGGIAPIIELKQKLELYFWAEDIYISLALLEVGKMHVALNAITRTEIPMWKLNPLTAPNKEWSHDNQALINYFEQ